MNKELLQKCIRNSGLKIEYIARCIGMTRQSLNNKMNGKSRFTYVEAVKLKKICRINDECWSKIWFYSDTK